MLRFIKVLLICINIATLLENKYPVIIKTKQKTTYAQYNDLYKAKAVAQITTIVQSCYKVFNL